MWSYIALGHNSTVFHLPLIFSISFLAIPTKASNKSIALWVVWAAGDRVDLVEAQKVVELSGTVARSIV